MSDEQKPGEQKSVLEPSASPPAGLPAAVTAGPPKELTQRERFRAIQHEPTPIGRFIPIGKARDPRAENRDKLVERAVQCLLYFGGDWHATMAPLDLREKRLVLALRDERMQRMVAEAKRRAAAAREEKQVIKDAE